MNSTNIILYCVWWWKFYREQYFHLIQTQAMLDKFKTPQNAADFNSPNFHHMYE